MSTVTTVVNCTCCNGGEGPPPCTEISPTPSITLHVVLTWHRPMFFGGEATFEFDAIWDGTGDVSPVRWKFQPLLEVSPGVFVDDPLIFCTPASGSAYVYELYGFDVIPDLCDETAPRGPGLATGGSVAIGMTTRGYTGGSGSGISGGVADSVSLDSVSPIAISGSLGLAVGCHADPFADGDGLNSDGYPVTNGPGWATTFTITEVP